MKRVSVAVIAVFFAVVLTLGVLVFALPDRTYSENENRMLETRPTPTVKTVLSGKWQAKFSEFLSDQMPLRDALTSLCSRIRILFGARDVGGAYIGKDGFYFSETRALNESRFTVNLGLVNRFWEEHPELDTRLLLAPDAGAVLSELLPAGAECYDAETFLRLARETLSGVETVDVYTPLTEAKATDAPETLYYRTDHHWTSHGAYLAYRAFCEARGTQPRDESSFGMTVFSDSFLGTLYSKVLTETAADTVTVPTLPDSVSAYTRDRTYEGDTVTATDTPISVIDEGAKDKKDAYLAFFGGNYGEVAVHNTEVHNGKCLLVIKDSYANCFVPYLTEEYETVVMLDLRYYGDRLSDTLTDYHVTEVLFLYNMSDFAEDGNLYKLFLE